MAYFRKLDALVVRLLEQFRRDERWLIVINADPDAMASALALRRIMRGRVADVAIARVNEISRPDNLAMARDLRIPMLKCTPTVVAQFDRFAMVDSQPHHHVGFAGMDFSVVIDHHPISEEHPVQAAFSEIRQDYGACSTILTEILYTMHIRPDKLLATALQYGIKTDTSSFERGAGDVDIRAYRFLSKFSKHALLLSIARSEYRMDWMDSFSQAIAARRKCASGHYVFLGEVENPDILVVIADFFMRVHEIRWLAVCGVYGETIVVIFRGDGTFRDLGRFAHEKFQEVGSAGGHKAMARAEIPVARAEGHDIDNFVFKKLTAPRKRVKKEEVTSFDLCDISQDQEAK